MKRKKTHTLRKEDSDAPEIGEKKRRDDKPPLDLFAWRGGFHWITCTYVFKFWENSHPVFGEIAVGSVKGVNKPQTQSD